MHYNVERNRNEDLAFIKCRKEPKFILICVTPKLTFRAPTSDPGCDSI